MVLSLVLVIVIVVSVFAAIQLFPASAEPLYIGITYCGDLVTEAQQLVDILYDDPALIESKLSKYTTVYYYNQTVS